MAFFDLHLHHWATWSLDREPSLLALAWDHISVSWWLML